MVERKHCGDIPAGSDVYGSGSAAVYDIDRQDAYMKVDLGLKLSDQDDKWSIDLFVKNALDEEIKTFGNLASGVVIIKSARASQSPGLAKPYHLNSSSRPLAKHWTP